MRNQVQEQVATLNGCQDGIASSGTSNQCDNDIGNFLLWCRDNQDMWLTEHGKEAIDSLRMLRESESKAQRQARLKEGWRAMMSTARTEPVVRIEAITADDLMDKHFSRLHNTKTGKALSKSGCGNERAAINHLHRVHNGKGHSGDMELHLKNLFKGLMRQPVQRNDEGEEGDDRGELREGKAEMSVELHGKLCGWMLELGTVEGVFGHCFLVLTWNLVC